MQVDEDTKRQIIKACARRKKRAQANQGGKSQTHAEPQQAGLWPEPGDAHKP